jgi:hypothetical protein
MYASARVVVVARRGSIAALPCVGNAAQVGWKLSISDGGTHVSSDWRELGRIVGLQIQRSSLKVGPRGDRYFDPAPLLAVEALYVTRTGVTVDPLGAQLDVHNELHPASKNVSGKNDISIGFTSHYATMRSRFGARIRDGIAGENILVACEQPIALDDLTGGILIVGDDGRRLELGHALVAHPCVEFSRYVLDDLQAPATLVSETLKFLDGGTRGFYAVVEGSDPARVAIGDRVFAVSRAPDAPL